AMPSNPLRVLLNACAMSVKPTGIWGYALELGAALSARDDCRVVFASPELHPPNTQHLIPPARLSEGRKRVSAVRLQWWTEVDLPQWMRHNSIDVYHGANCTVPAFSRIPRVATIHDLAPLTRAKLFRGVDNKLYWRLLIESAKRATMIVVPSTPVADDVTRLLGVPARRIAVTPLAPRAMMTAASEESVALVKARLGIERPYLLCVGIWNRNKRAVDAMRALALLRGRGVDLQLVLCGEPMPQLAPLYKREAERLGIADRVVCVGHVPDDDLPALYTGALVLVFPSEMEGFGLPPLEAMNCGTPAIVSSIPALLEATGGAAIVVNLRSPGEIADRVAELAANAGLRQEWVTRGRERVANFTWARTAAATMDVYRSIT
ncbi:MAG: glycosyltransferase family 1 protein, partial [Anaerolineaceae bacterium]